MFSNDIDLVCSYIDHPCCIALFEVKQHGRLMEKGEHCHVFNFIKLWWVLGMNISFLYSDSLLKAEKNASIRVILVKWHQISCFVQIVL